MDVLIGTEASTLSSELSASSVSFLNERFRSREDLSKAKSLVSELEAECVDLDRNLIELNSRLGVSLVAYASFSDRAHGLFDCISAQLKDLGSLTGGSNTRSDGGGRGVLGEGELATLAREVARVETARAYAETALKLYILVEDIEDAVSFTLSKNLKNSSTQNSEELRRQAIETLGKVEDIVAEVTKTRPRWSNLASAADHRVDRALAILRPQAIADHRAVLASLGWPPPLTTLNSSNPYVGKSGSVRNPLFTMQGDLKLKYCENFLFLCHLQGLQHRRKSRQLEGHYREVALRQPLWAIEELVNPVSLAAERHFAKWIDKPELIFALVYKITRDFVDSMDELLQPLVDEANLAGYSCREEWIASMISALCTYLAKEIFPDYVSQMEEENVPEINAPARSSWLHLVDLMISFDKRIKSLVSNSGISFSLIEEVNLQKLSSLSVFCDRPDWLELWAQIELTDTLEKVSSETDNENVWNKKTQGSIHMFGSEDFRSPAISDFFLQHLSSVIDRSRALPLIEMRSKFMRLTSVPIIEKFLDSLLLRCQEAEGLTALTDDDALIKVAKSINASRHFESVLRDWSDDVFFVEMVESETEAGILDLEISKLEKFREEWVEKLSVVILRGFDSLSRDYVKIRKQSHKNDEEDWTVSRSLVSALDYLQGKLFTLQESINQTDFVGLWRRIANGIDKLFLNSLFLSNTKFQSTTVERLSYDMDVLFGVFRSWCSRPEGFFPRISDGLKLLKMGEEQVRVCLAGGEIGLKEQDIRVLSTKEAEKITKNW